MGRRAHRPDLTTRRHVEAMAGYGVPEDDIAGVIGIDPKTLRKHYRSELSHGHVKANARVAESLYRKATSDSSQSVTAAIFWLKTRAGWKETSVRELTGSGGPPLTVVVRRFGDHDESAESASGRQTPDAASRTAILQ